MDKKNIALGNTIKQLQRKLKFLEEQQAASEDESWSSSSSQPLPEIEARVSGNTVLIKVFCEQRKGLLVKILGEVEKLNMAVVTATLSTFGCSTLDITVVAEMQMDREMNLETVDIVTTLRSSLLAADN